ncbi:hypothetical protein FLA_5144 [Filimonas lacunae]|nr:hypothetical protein FLA_5144 [Filimonas lacunae]
MCLVVAGISAAQTPFNGSYPHPVPVSPNSAALFKAEQKPVGSFTGTTPINIPLCQLSDGPLTVPVGISYNNGGIKVEEIASSVGLGWNLAGAGGRVTRVMNGVPDDGPYGILPSSLKPSGFPGTSTTFLQNVNEVLRNRLDMEPDLYYFECNGISGKFFFDETGTIKLTEQLPVTIERLASGSAETTGWLITDDKGNRYEFGVPEFSQVIFTTSGGYGIPPGGSNYYNTWHMIKMEDKTQEHSVDFSYSTTNTSITTVSGSHYRITGAVGVDCTPEDNMSNVTWVTTLVYESTLESITAGNAKLVIYNSGGRTDLSGGKMIDSIKLFSLPDLQVQKSFHLNHGYFTGNRLKLKNLAEMSLNNTDSVVHSFSYLEGENLPATTSFDTDYWGYYNGPNYNSSQLPNGVYTWFNAPLVVDEFAERRANPHFAETYTLNKITYPTGGYREFIYEGNKALPEEINQLRPDLKYYTTEQFDTSAFTFDYPSQPAYQHSFTINSTEKGVSFRYYINGYTYNTFTVKIIRVFEYTEYEVIHFTNDYDRKIDLDNGNYRLELSFSSSFGNEGIYGIYAYWQQLNYNAPLIYYKENYYYKDAFTVGGIRVKELREYDPVTNVTNTVNYKYNWFTDTTISSGLLISPVIVIHAGGCATPIRFCEYLRLSSSSQYPLSAEGGSYVCYPEVTTRETGNGYTEREYSFAADGNLSYISDDEFPVAPWPDYGYMRGKVVSEKVYDNSGQLLIKNLSLGLGFWGEELRFSPDDHTIGTQMMINRQLAYKVTGYYRSQYCNNEESPNLYPCLGCWKPYYFTSLFSGLKVERAMKYGVGQVNELRKEYDYHTAALRPVLKCERTYLNDGNIQLTYHQYAFNSNNSFRLGLNATESLRKDVLLTMNYLQPIETVTYIKKGNDSLMLSATKTVYQYFNGKLKPAEIRNYTSFSDSSVLYITRYDGKGNVQEQRVDNKPNEVLLWGYNNTYLVAKITGSDYDTVASLVNNSILQSPANDAALQSELNNLRNALASTVAQVTSYTVKPLVGITSETDPSGKTTYYTYDAYNRLQLVKDDDGNIIKKHLYHYYGQPVSTY